MKKIALFFLSTLACFSFLHSQSSRIALLGELKPGVGRVANWGDGLPEPLDFDVPVFSVAGSFAAEVSLGSHFSIQAGLSLDGYRQRVLVDSWGLAGVPDSPRFTRNTFTIFAVAVPARFFFSWGKGKISFVHSAGVLPWFPFALGERISTADARQGPWTTSNSRFEWRPQFARSFNINLELASGIEADVSEKMSMRLMPYFEYHLLDYIPQIDAGWHRWRVGLSISCLFRM